MTPVSDDESLMKFSDTTISYHSTWLETTVTAKTPFDRGIRYFGNYENDFRPWYQIPSGASLAV